MSFSSFFDYSGTSAPDRSDDLTFLGNLSDDGWDKLLGYAQMVRFNAGDIVIREGDTDRALYIVGDGVLELLVPQGGGRGLRRLGTFEAGSVIGEMAFSDARPRSAAIRAVTEAELFRLSLEDFEVLAAREPVLGRTILFDLGRILSARLRQTNAMMGG